MYISMSGAQYRALMMILLSRRTLWCIYIMLSQCPISCTSARSCLLCFFSNVFSLLFFYILSNVLEHYSASYVKRCFALPKKWLLKATTHAHVCARAGRLTRYLSTGAQAQSSCNGRPLHSKKTASRPKQALRIALPWLYPIALNTRGLSTGSIILFGSCAGSLVTSEHGLHDLQL